MSKKNRSDDQLELTAVDDDAAELETRSSDPAEEPAAEEPAVEEPAVEESAVEEPSAEQEEQEEAPKQEEAPVEFPAPEATSFERAVRKNQLEHRVRRLLNSYVDARISKTKDRMAKLKKEHPALFAEYTAELTAEQVKSLLP